MNYIMYQESRVEKDIFHKVRKNYGSGETIYVKSDSEFIDALKSVKFKPLFNDMWLLVVTLDKLSHEYMMESLKLILSPKVQCYYRIQRDRLLFQSLKSSETIGKIPNLTILNSKYPTIAFVRESLLRDVKKPFADKVVDYVYEEIKHNIDELDKVITTMNECDFDEITVKDIQELLPKSKTRDVRSLVYTMLLNFRTDIPKKWKDPSYKEVVQYAGKKKKQYEILDNIEMPPDRLLIFIIETLTAMKKIKLLYSNAIITETSIFNDKDDLVKRYKFMEYLTIPTIRNYIFVGREVTFREIDFCLNEFLLLRQQEEVTKDDLFLALHKVLKRHDKFDKIG